MNSITFVIDRLNTAALGCYGNCWLETPQFDQLATESCTFDQTLIDSPHLDRLYRSFWRGVHALAPDSVAGSQTPLPALCSASGIHALLLTDQREIADLPDAAHFDDIVRLPEPPAGVSARELHETQAARIVASVCDALEQPPEPFALWIHAQGLGGPWDAPLALRDQFVEDDDPLPPRTAVPPALELPADPDPDLLLGWRRSYAAQVLTWDACLGGLWECLQHACWADRTLFTLLGARGLALGRHGTLGGHDLSLHGDLVQVPCWLRLPDPSAGNLRSAFLWQPPDLCATLRRWHRQPDLPPGVAWGVDVLPIARDESTPYRDRAACWLSPCEHALRTPAWYVRRAATSATEPAEPPPQLYVKPDDRWEVNEIASRMPDIPPPMDAAYQQFSVACQQVTAEPLPPLPESLLHAPA